MPRSRTIEAIKRELRTAQLTLDSYWEASGYIELTPEDNRAIKRLLYKMNTLNRILDTMYMGDTEMEITIAEAVEMYETYRQICDTVDMEVDLELSEYILDLKDKGYVIIN